MMVAAAMMIVAMGCGAPRTSRQLWRVIMRMSQHADDAIDRHEGDRKPGDQLVKLVEHDASDLWRQTFNMVSQANLGKAGHNLSSPAAALLPRQPPIPPIAEISRILA